MVSQTVLEWSGPLIPLKFLDTIQRSMRTVAERSTSRSSSRWWPPEQVTRTRYRRSLMSSTRTKTGENCFPNYIPTLAQVHFIHGAGQGDGRSWGEAFWGGGEAKQSLFEQAREICVFSAREICVFSAREISVFSAREICVFSAREISVFFCQRNMCVFCQRNMCIFCQRNICIFCQRNKSLYFLPRKSEYFLPEISVYFLAISRDVPRPVTIDASLLSIEDQFAGFNKTLWESQNMPWELYVHVVLTKNVSQLLPSLLLPSLLLPSLLLPSLLLHIEPTTGQFPM